MFPNITTPNIIQLAASKLSMIYDENIANEFNLPKPVIGALTGIPIIGIVEHIAGPAALSTLVGDGAIGISVEPSVKGDPSRYYLSHECFSTFHAGKMSIAMDLKTDPHYEKLLNEAVVIIDNRSKRARDQDKTLQTFLADSDKKQRVIYCHISGYPGEDEIKPGNDVTVQAATGMAYINAPAVNQPLKVGSPILDFAAADWAVIAIQAKLIQMLRGIPIKDEVNKVIPIHVTLAGVAARILCAQYLDADKSKPIAPRKGNRDNFISIFSFFKTKDNFYLSIATLNDAAFKKFCDNVIVRPDLAEKYPTNAERLQHSDFIHTEIEHVIATKSKSEWITKLSAENITFSEVNSVEIAVTKPFAKHVYTETNDGTKIMARPDGAKSTLNPAPKLNQHGKAIAHLLNSNYNFLKSRFSYSQTTEEQAKKPEDNIPRAKL